VERRSEDTKENAGEREFVGNGTNGPGVYNPTAFDIGPLQIWAGLFAAILLALGRTRAQPRWLRPAFKSPWPTTNRTST
jgi:hypothetical protein